MRIGILGTGMVGNTLGTKFVELGHEVKMGSRTADNEDATAWTQKTNSTKASHGTFADATSFGEIVINCTPGTVSVEALKLAGEQNLRGKVLIDVSNGVDFSRGIPPTLPISNTDSVAEQIQKAFPEVRVVKTLNTMRTTVMVNPKLLPGETDVFVSGNDPDAKSQVTKLLKELGWTSIIDLGDIRTARGPEMYFVLWILLSTKFQNPMFNLKLVRQNG